MEKNFFNQFAKPRNLKSSKWSTYFEAYENHLSRFVNNSPFIIEIGVAEGGSLGYWSEILGPGTKVLGLDILDSCKNFENPTKNIFVEVLDARSPNIVEGIIDKYGLPDIIIDDGDHNSAAMRSSLYNFWPLLADYGVYIIEDLHGIFWQEPEKLDFSILDTFQKEIIGLNAPGSRNHAKSANLSKSLYSMSYYWSLVILEKRNRLAVPQCIESLNGELKLITEAH